MSSSTTPGIDINRLLEPEQHQNFLELIKCKICFNILLNPYDCTICGNSFCYSCINSLIENNQSCPFKCTSYQIKPSSFGITSYLSKLNFSCLNKNNGCNEIIPYNNLITHDKECKYFYTTCPNIQCSKKMKWTLLENHIKNECLFSLFKCPYCDIKLKRNEYKEHVVNCQSVQMSMPIPNKEDPNEEKEKSEKFENLINSLPDLKEITLTNFLKVILNQISLNNLYLDKKFDVLKSEMQNIKDNLYQISNSNIIFFENINNEFEELNKKIEKLEINDKEKEELQTSISEAMKNVNEQKEKNIKKIPLTKSNNNSTNLSQDNTSSVKRRKQKSKSLKKDKIEIPSLKASQQRCYSPRVPNNYFTEGNEIDYITNVNTLKNSNLYSGNINQYYQPPIARPFNTFSSFTHSNLVSIIHNQEVILKKISVIEKAVNIEASKIDTIDNQMDLSQSNKL